MRSYISSINGATKFPGRCKHTFHLVEYKTNNTRSVTVHAIDSNPTSTPHDIMSIGRLLELHESNKFTFNNTSRLQLQLTKG